MQQQIERMTLQECEELSEEYHPEINYTKLYFQILKLKEEAGGTG